MIGAFTNRMAAVLWVILVLSIFTVADRIILTYRELRRTEEAIATVLRRDQHTSPSDAATLAHIVSAIMFLSMATTINIARSVDEILEDIRSQVRVLLPH